MRERILAIAADEGYEFNYYAASLRRTRLKIAVIMGTHDRDSRFFVDRIADGIQRCIDANSQFNIDYRFLTYTGRDMTSAKAGQIVSDLKKETFDGVLMHVLKLPDKAIENLSKALSGDMPVVAHPLLGRYREQQHHPDETARKRPMPHREVPEDSREAVGKV